MAAAVKGLYIGIASCRNAYNLLFLMLHGFLREHLQFASHGLPSEDVLYAMWSDLGLEPKVAEELGALGLLYEHDAVWVRPELEGSTDLVARVHGAFVSVMKFRKFSESRWVSVGSCSRSLVAAQLIGLPALVQAVRDSPLSQYYIHGYWDWLTSDSLKYGVVAALSGRVVDAALIMILEDDRIAGRGHELEAAMQEEWEWLTSIPDTTWHRLSVMVSKSGPPENIRVDCIIATQASYAFLHWRLFRVLDSYPWLLCHGSADDRLTELHSMSSPPPGADDTTDKIHHLLHLPYSREKLVAAIELMKQCPFSTRGVEQAHASCSIMNRLHPGCGLDQLMSRGLLHAAKPLAQDPETDAMSRSIDKLKAKVRRLEGKDGTGRTGRQLFLGEMMAHVIGGKTLPQDKKKGAQWSFAHHTQLWNELSAQEKQKYEEMSRVKREAFFAELRGQVAELKIEIIAKQKALDQRKKGEGLSPVTLSGNRFSAEDMRSMAEMSAGPEFQKTALLGLRKDALTNKPPLPDHEVKFLMETPVNIGQHQPDLCDWMKRVCFLRSEFRGKVIVVDLGTRDEKSYLFSFALQNPHVAAFQRLTKLVVTLPHVSTVQVRNLQGFLRYLDDIWPWQFELKMTPPAYGWEFNGVEKNRVWVLQHCDVVDSKIASPSQPIPFDDFVRDLPTFKGGKKGDTRKKAEGHYGTPSTAASSSKGHYGEPAAKKVRCDDESSDDCEPRFEELDDPGKKALWEWLAANKIELHKMRYLPSTLFAASFRGGNWTAKKKGVNTDCVVGEAQTKVVKEWAKGALGNMMASFSIKKFDEDLAGALACLWSDRMEFFYICHKEGRLVNGCLTAELQEEAPKPTLCEDILARKGRADHPGHMRLAEIMLIQPKES